MEFIPGKEQELLFRLNPMVKIILMVLITLAVTFDYYPFMPALVLVLVILATVLLGKIKLRSFLQTIMPFTLIALGFIIFTLFSRGLSIDESPALTFLGLKWTRQDLIISIALGIRILAVTTCSASFVLTTNPVDFILSLIKYLKLPYKIGYAVMAAYRFLPTFKEELSTIQFAHEIRGVENKKGLISRISSLKRYLIPMLATAVRKGERLSFAMETRAFGAYQTRTNFREVNFTREDGLVLTIAIIIFAILLLVLNNFQLLNMSLGFNLR